MYTSITLFLTTYMKIIRCGKSFYLKSKEQDEHEMIRHQEKTTIIRYALYCTPDFFSTSKGTINTLDDNSI